MGFGLSSIKKAAGSIGSIAKSAGSVLNLGQSIGGMFGMGQPHTVKSGHEIRSRVNDAIKAGVHPLFALGANVGSSQQIGGMTGSGVGDALQDLGTNLQGYPARAAAKQAAGLAARQAESAIRVNETQAMLNEARSRSVIAEMQNNPGVLNQITAMPLDASHGTDPTGRLAWFMDANNKYQRVNRRVAPSSVLEQEYGEVSELQGILRTLKALPEFGGVMDWPSLNELRMMINK